MAKIRVDFSDTPDSEYAVPGKYTARVKSTNVKTGDKGQYIEWTLDILNGASKGKTILHRTHEVLVTAIRGASDTACMDIPRK